MTDAPRRTIYLVRHGQTEWNAERRMQGQWDSRLSEAGRAHADASGRFLATCGVEAVFASPLGRVQETAAIIRRHLDIEPVNDPRLMEWSSGDWSGRLYADLQTDDPETFAAWRADMINVRSPNGENFLDLAVRARSFLDDIAESRAQTIALIAHGFINRALLCAVTEAEPATMLGVRQGNDAIICVKGHGPNAEVCHYVGGEGPHAGPPTEAAQPVA
ncbi:MAG: histidine phosphatase family protein [Hyphomonadaceae bacterium]